MNNVNLIGRLTKDPESRKSANGNLIVTFTLAIDRVGKADEKQTDFPRVIVFGKQAENCMKYLHKGLLTAVIGRIQTSNYKNKDGNTIFTTDVVAERVEFLEWGKDKPAGSAGHAAAAAAPAPSPASADVNSIDDLDDFDDEY